MQPINQVRHQLAENEERQLCWSLLQLTSDSHQLLLDILLSILVTTFNAGKVGVNLQEIIKTTFVQNAFLVNLRVFFDKILSKFEAEFEIV